MEKHDIYKRKMKEVEVEETGWERYQKDVELAIENH